MPVYDYRCKDCNRVTSVLTYSWKTSSEPACRSCAAVSWSSSSPGLRFTAPGRQSQLGAQRRDPDDVNEDSPKIWTDSWGGIKQEMGGEVTSDFNQMRKELTSDS